jgi:hypothetical protein
LQGPGTCPPLSRAFTRLPSRASPRRPTEPVPLARWHPAELHPLFPQPPLPHRITDPKHLQPLLLRQERHRAQDPLTACPPSPGISWISSPRTVASRSSSESRGTCMREDGARGSWPSAQLSLQWGAWKLGVFYLSIIFFGLVNNKVC